MNKKYFDMNSSNHWNTLSSWMFDPFPEEMCDLSFNDCVNNHTLKSCKRRRLIEGNPFTRPMTGRILKGWS